MPTQDTVGEVRAALGDRHVTAADFDRCVQEFQEGLGRFFDGDPGPCKALMSRQEDVTLANPFGPIVRGWAQVEQAMDRAGLNYRDGAALGFDWAARYVTPVLAYTLWVERFTTKVGDRTIEGALRRTTVYRPESGSWRVVHTHADPITTPRGAESLSSGN